MEFTDRWGVVVAADGGAVGVVAADGGAVGVVAADGGAVGVVAADGGAVGVVAADGGAVGVVAADGGAVGVVAADGGAADSKELLLGPVTLLPLGHISRNVMDAPGTTVHFVPTSFGGGVG
jgi:hypothetical protein